MTTFDPRLTPARPDLAARHLVGQVEAARFVDGEVFEIIDAAAPLRQAPSPDAPLDTEALLGERVTIYEITDEGWAWGQLDADHYVGWLPASALGTPGAAATHKVCALRTLVFPGPSIKLPPIAAPSFGARVAVTHHHERFAVTAGGGYLPARHLGPIDHNETDFVAVAERFLGVPYLWGGKTSLGVDCSGLVQVALAACGVAAPRDTDLQERAVGIPVGADRNVDVEKVGLRRGDLVFWKGHVAIVRDAATLLHANAFHMAVVAEPIADAVTRITASDGAITSIRRPGVQ